MNPCLSGGGGRATYGIDLEIIKSQTTRSPTASSPSSTISDTSNSPTNISTRKPRTARKRPNQKYNEAAALLSTACPRIFSSRHLLEPCKFSKLTHEFSLVLEEAESAAELLLPFPPFDEKPTFGFEPRAVVTSPQNQITSCAKLGDEYDGQGDDFDAESILDEEIEGIDGIMGSVNVKSSEDGSEGKGPMSNGGTTHCYGYPFMGSLGQLDSRFGVGVGVGVGGRRVSAFRNVDRGEWCSFPFVNVGEISPRFEPKRCQTQKRKKKKKVEDIIKAASVDSNNSNNNNKHADPNYDPKTPPSPPAEDPAPTASDDAPRLLLNLNYDEVLSAWSDRGLPFSDEIPGAEGMGTAARLAQIDLFGDRATGGSAGGTGIGGVREARVQRYKEKRRARLFSKKIRYQVRKVNADQRPRMKGRFVKTPDTMETPSASDKKRISSKSKNKNMS